MNDLTDVLIFTLPLLIIALIIVAIIFGFIRYERRRATAKQKAEASKTILNLRLQACERIMLFLERISPVQLISRIKPGNTDAQTYRFSLIHSIREEYEHNITQQIYVSETVWEQVKSARESVTALINMLAGNLNDSSTANELATAILEEEMKTPLKQLETAKKSLKQEVKKLF